MQKKSNNNNLNGKKRILATKKVVPASSSPTLLKFKRVSGAELKSSRNPAYTYLVK